MLVWKIIILILGTAGLIFVSRASLRDPRSHGFYRFFAWETILILFLLNINYWFLDPFSWYQGIAWLLLVICIIPVIWGILLLHKRGKPLEKRAGDPNLLAFEKTTVLVTNGIFRYIRHPLYSSLLFLTWGVFFKHPSWSGFSLVVVASAFLILTARADEDECIQYFGSSYQEYMKRTKRFIPHIY